MGKSQTLHSLPTEEASVPLFYNLNNHFLPLISYLRSVDTASTHKMLISNIEKHIDIGLTPINEEIKSIVAEELLDLGLARAHHG